MKKLLRPVPTGVVLLALLLMAPPTPAAADSSVSNPPSTYVNANFGAPDLSGFNFYRSSTTLDFDSTTADVFAKRSASQVRLSVSANADPYENSAAYSAYDMGTVNAGSESLTSVTVVPRSLSLSGTAHWAMNLWFDSDHNGEYFAWTNNRLTGLGGDVYGIGPCESNPPVAPCTAPGDGTITIDQNTPMFVIAANGMGGCNTGDYTATLAKINLGLCTKIPANTNVAMWVGIDIQNGTVGSGRATIGTANCRNGHGDGDFQDSDGHHHHGQFNGNECDNGGSSVRDDDNQGNHFESNSVSASTFTEDLNSETLTMTGTGLDNGVPVGFTLVTIDYGVLAPTVYTLTLTDGRTIIGTLVSGDTVFE